MRKKLFRLFVPIAHCGIAIARTASAPAPTTPQNPPRVAAAAQTPLQTERAANLKEFGDVRQADYHAAVPLAGAQNAKPESTPAAGSARELIHRIQQDFDFAQRKYFFELGKLQTDKERQAAVGNVPRASEYFPRIWEVIERKPSDPDAYAGLRWMFDRRRIEERGILNKILGQIGKYHIANPDVGSVCQTLCYFPSPETELFLKRVAAESKIRDVRARASCALAKQWKLCAELADRIQQKQFIDAKELEEMSKLYGSELIEMLGKADSAGKRAEAERAFERVAEEFGDIAEFPGQPAPLDRPLKATAAGEIYELRNLVVGRLAPEIEGLGVDGKPMKLGDYRGKVVLLDFWGSWCTPCVDLIPRERELIKRLDGKPFAIVGVNSDLTAEDANVTIKNEKISWPSFFDGTLSNGAIVTKWNIRNWPTLYMIDANGIIRFKTSRTESIERVVDALVRECKAENSGKTGAK